MPHHVLVRCAVALLLAASMAGCTSDGRMRLPSLLGGSVTDASGEAVESVEPVTFGEWRKDELDCEAGRCQNIYGVMAPRGGVVEVQVFAPYGTTDAPDFDLVLLDRNGEPLARPMDAYGRPRKLSAQIDPGSYFVRVAPRGPNNERLRYEIVASFEPTKSKSRSKSKPPAAGSTKSPSRVERTPTKASNVAASDASSAQSIVRPVASVPASKPTSFAGQTPVVTAEVLDVEEREGVASFVLLDAGAASVSVGMRGLLMDDGASIGEFVIIEVLPDGSRARLTAAPRGEFSIDTVADIYEARR